MAQILTRMGMRCQEHPHHPAHQRCNRCARTYCAECLTPTPRRADGTRDWYCSRCHVLLDELRAAGATRRSLRSRLVQLRRRAQVALMGGLAITGVVGALLGIGVVLVRVAPGVLPSSTGTRQAGYEAHCGELSRIQSVSSIGTQGPDDAVNIFAYPQRALVQVVGGSTGAAPVLTLPGVHTQNTAATGGGAAAAASDPATLVDECDTGWHLPAPVHLPITMELATHHVGSYIQRIALWQDPSAPRGAWVKDFEVLISETDTGEDFRPATLDRPAQLQDTPQSQWFQLVQRGVGAPATSAGAAQVFTDPILVRRLRVRLLSTYDPAARQGIALGEVAALGSDRDVVIFDLPPPPLPLGPYPVYAVRPTAISALRGHTTFVRFTNNSFIDHHMVASGLPELDLPLPAGETRIAKFTAGRSGRVPFYCKLSTHAIDGLSGTIQIK